MMTKNSKEMNYNKIFTHKTLNRRKISQLKQTCNNQRFAFFCRELMQLHLLRRFKITNSVSYSIGSLLSAFLSCSNLCSILAVCIVCDHPILK